jgi:hypothetical protein
MASRRFFSLVFLLTLLALLFCCEQVLQARAGGGHSYSSPSSSRPSSSGGAGGSAVSGSRPGMSGGGDSFFQPSAMDFILLFVVLPSFLGVLVLCAIFEPKKMIKEWLRANTRYLQPELPKTSLNPLKTKDPAFAEEKLITRAKKAFLEIQQAWMERDLARASAFLSDGIFAQFCYQIQEMKERKIIDRIDKIEFLAVYPVGHYSDENFDVVHLFFNVRAGNYREDENTGRILDGKKRPQSFSEIWTFIRRIGSKTVNKAGLIEGNCPNCGKLLQKSRLAKCEACGALLRSGEYDWVLTNISQELDLQAFSASIPPGFSELKSIDRGFCLQQLAEISSIVFWNLREAEKTGVTQKLNSLATEKFSQQISDLVKPMPSGIRRFHSSCVTGLIKPRAIAREENEQIALIEIKWSSVPASIIGNRKNFSTGRPEGQVSYFILRRNAQAVSRLELSFSASHCPGCGAPAQAENQDFNKCSYCNAFLPERTNQWALDSIHSREDYSVKALLSLAQKLSSSS